MSLKIISWNVNGLRAVYKKNALQEFLSESDPDIFCIQETKCKKDQIENIIEEFSNYEQFYESAEKAGYAGTSVWIKKNKLTNSTFDAGMHEFYDDNEGRISRVDFDYEQKSIVLLTVYFPNGGKSSEAWKEKLVFYAQFLKYIQQIEEEGRVVIFCGDINTCHHEIDIARPKANEGKIGFHPDERALLTSWVEAGWKDVWREKNANLADQYSWWSYRGGARDRNVGWRIDYFFIPESLLQNIKTIQYLNNQKGSDHCPVEIVL